MNSAFFSWTSIPGTYQRLAEQIDVAGYVAQAASALERIDAALECIYRGKRLAEATGQTPETSSVCRRLLGRPGRIGTVATARIDADARLVKDFDYI
jgi:hypothetical protein